MNESENENRNTTDDETTSFARLLDVVPFLKGAGYKASRSTIYRHFSEGKIRCKNGTFTLRDVRKYAALHLNKTDQKSTGNRTTEAARERRVLADAQKSEAHAALLTMKAKILEGSYIPKADFERALAMRAIVFRNDLTNWVHTETPGIVRLVAGDDKLIPDLVEYMLDKVEEFLDRYAQDREFEVVIPGPIPETLVKEENDPDEE
jgi:hypothetical protein